MKTPAKAAARRIDREGPAEKRLAATGKPGDLRRGGSAFGREGDPDPLRIEAKGNECPPELPGTCAMPAMGRKEKTTAARTKKSEGARSPGR